MANRLSRLIPSRTTAGFSSIGSQWVRSARTAVSKMAVQTQSRYMYNKPLRRSTGHMIIHAAEASSHSKTFQAILHYDSNCRFN